MLTAAGLSESSEAVSTLWAAADTIEAEAHALLPRMLTLRGVRWLNRQARLLSETLRSLSETTDIEAARQRCGEIAARRQVFHWLVRPLRVALVGPPNVGKSTLANALADQHVSLVSPAPGTTRDWVETPGEIDGFPVLWLDTAGLRSAGDELEAEGIRRTQQLMESADAVVLVLDAAALAAPRQTHFFAQFGHLRPACVALNKCDLIETKPVRHGELPAEWQALAVGISATQRVGLETLTARLLENAGYDVETLATPAAFTDRQVEILKAAATADRAGIRELLRRCVGESRSA